MEWVPLPENLVIPIEAGWARHADGAHSDAEFPECVVFDPIGWKEGDTYYALIGNKNHRSGYEGDSTSLFKSGIAEGYVEQVNLEEGTDVIHLIPKSGWWTAAWCAKQEWVSVDICSPPKLIDGEWYYTDLELDPILFPDGRVIVEDEDEFAEGCDAGMISAEEAMEVLAASDEVVRCMREGIEPFGRAGWDKLKKVMTFALPPIRELKDVTLEGESG